jgi:hypothetical protein
MGYFASIARHSGLQFSGQPLSARSGPPAPSDALAPLDVEETVIVPPSTDDRPARVEAGVPHQAAHDDAASTPTEPRRAADPAPVPIWIPIPRTEAAPVLVRDQRIPMATPAARPGAAPAMTQESADAPIPVVGGPPEIHQTLLTADPELIAPTHDHGAEVLLRIEKTPANYFTRTAELLAAPAPDPIETRTVFLREVQDWIADGPGDTTPREPSAPSSPEIVVAGDDTPQPPLEPGVRRIATSHRAAPVIASTEERTGIEEQRLELSIGTISVVIEGEDRSRPGSHRPPERQIERPSPPPRRTPRLRRHYL